MRAIHGTTRRALLATAVFAPAIAVAAPDLMNAARSWTTEPATGPGISYRTFESKAARTTVSYHVYLPPHYGAESRRRFPALYWLHGSGGGLGGIPRLAQFFDRAIRAGTAPPMIVVFPNGHELSMWCDAKDGSVPMETVVVRELVPAVDASLRTIAAAEGRLVEGFSMGGYGAARLGFTHRNVFSAASMLAAGPLQLDFTQGPRSKAQTRRQVLDAVYGGDMAYFRDLSPWQIAERNTLALRGMPIRQAVGDRDELRPANQDFHDHLNALGIGHDFFLASGVGHDAPSLITALGDQMWAFHRRVFAQK
jgi:S-formylglutathione hydrolase FrmB